MFFRPLKRDANVDINTYNPKPFVNKKSDEVKNPHRLKHT
jgi:hypothetical protein